MRRWLTLLLLVLLPLQFSWAAVASYCGHETGTQTQQLGHHDHHVDHHHADQADLNKAKVPGSSAAPTGNDFDCGHCHTPCCAMPALAYTPPPLAIASNQVTQVEGIVRTLAQNPPERPQWVRFA